MTTTRLSSKRRKEEEEGVVKVPKEEEVKEEDDDDIFEDNVSNSDEELYSDTDYADLGYSDTERAAKAPKTKKKGKKATASAAEATPDSSLADQPLINTYFFQSASASSRSEGSRTGSKVAGLKSSTMPAGSASSCGKEGDIRLFLPNAPAAADLTPTPEPTPKQGVKEVRKLLSASENKRDRTERALADTERQRDIALLKAEDGLEAIKQNTRMKSELAAAKAKIAEMGRREEGFMRAMNAASGQSTPASASAPRQATAPILNIRAGEDVKVKVEVGSKRGKGKKGDVRAKKAKK